MVQIYHNYLSKDDCDWIISYYNNNKNDIFRETNEYVTNYEGIEIGDDTNFILNKKFDMKLVEYLRIQKTDINVIPNLVPHTHQTPFNFVIFLNENFNGGDLFIDNKYIRPKMGTMIYFTGDEEHYPTPVSKGERYVIACFLSKDIFSYKHSII